MKQKRGQFYLIAAVIIMGIVIGIGSISNFAEKKSYNEIYDFGEELKIESEKVLDHGIYNKKNIKSLLTDFTKDYANYTRGEKDLYFVFGNEDLISGVAYQYLSDETIYVNIGEGNEELIADGEVHEIGNPTGEEITIIIEEENYNFKLKKGENFYFIVSQEIGNEKYIVTG